MVETPNKAPRMRVHLLRLGRVMVVEVLSWDKMIVRVGMLWARMVLLFCEVGKKTSQRKQLKRSIGVK